jgi:hypothetical protein
MSSKKYSVQQNCIFSPTKCILVRRVRQLYISHERVRRTESIFAIYLNRLKFGRTLFTHILNFPVKSVLHLFVKNFLTKNLGLKPKYVNYTM